MALTFVAAPVDTVQFGRPDDLQKEWQECRTAIGRLDSTLVDLRKYGFGLASGLLTAGGVLGGIANILPKESGSSTGAATPSPSAAAMFTVSPAVVAVIVAVTVLLVMVLFVVDRYYTMIQWAMINRAKGLERALSLGTTLQISEWARWSKPMIPIIKKDLWLWRWVALVQYGGFVLVAFALGAVVVGIQYWLWLLLALLVSLAFIWLIFRVADYEYGQLQIPPAFARDVSLQAVRLSPGIAFKPGTDDYTITRQNAFPEKSHVLAVVIDVNDQSLSAVGCHIDGDTRALTVTVRNLSGKDIPLGSGTCQVFSYVPPS